MKDDIRQILTKPELKEGLKKYQYIMQAVQDTDVRTDAEFQKIFRDFYQMRRFYSDDFARHYFILMQQLKETGPDMTFRMALERVKHIQGTYEMSFSSKLAHTINPLLPIWDSVVTKGHFGIKAPYAGARNKEEACCRKYAEFEDAFYDYMATDDGLRMIHAFDEAFPGSGISDVKKVDFVLWQDR